MPWLDSLLAATQYKSPKFVSKLLRSEYRSSPDGPIKEFVTPLHLAVLNDDITSVRYLIRRGADINIVNHEGETPLHLSVDETTSLKTFKELLKAKPNLNIHDFDYNTPLHCACLGPYFDKIKEMLQQPTPPVNSKDDEGATPIHYLIHACEESEEAAVLDIVRLAVKKGFILNSQTNYGDTILHVASQGVNSEQLLQGLLQLDGIDATLQDKHGNNFLHSFFYYRKGVDLCEEFLCLLFEKVPALISQEDQITILNQRNKDGLLPLTFYIKLAIINLKVAVCILDFMENIDIQDNIGQSLLHLTIISALPLRYKIRILRQAIKKNANVNLKDIFGRTPIFLATDLSIVTLLVEHGANVNVTDQCKRTPLIATLRSGNPRICQFLVNRGSRIDMRDKFGHTALHYAAWENRFRELDVLIRNGADVFRKDRVGRYPRDIASYWRCRKAVDILGDAMMRNSCSQRKSKHNVKTLDLPDVRLWIYIKRFTVSRDFNSMPDMRKQLHIPNDVEQYFETLLQFPGIGIPGKVDEAPWVETLVLEMVKEISIKIGETDPRFKCSVFRSGSTFEGTKIDDPDEFDFIFVLEKFSEIVKVKSNLQSDHPNYGFEKLSCKSETVDPAFQRYFTYQQTLMCERLRQDFYVLLCQILFSRQIWIFDELYTDAFSIKNLPNKPVVNFRIFFNGAFYKGITISVDVVPALRVENWKPHGANLLENHFVSTQVLSKHFLLLCQTPEDTGGDRDEPGVGTLFRVSCAPFEIELMQSLPDWIRQSYALAKMMKGNFMCPGIHFEQRSQITTLASEEISSYMLKNCLFHVLATKPDILKCQPHVDKSLLYNSVELAIQIFKTLREAATRQSLPVYFLPHLNIFRDIHDVNEDEHLYEDMDVNMSDKEDPARENSEHEPFERVKAFCELIIKLYSPYTG